MYRTRSVPSAQRRIYESLDAMQMRHRSLTRGSLTTKARACYGRKRRSDRSANDLDSVRKIPRHGLIVPPSRYRQADIEKDREEFGLRGCLDSAPIAHRSIVEIEHPFPLNLMPGSKSPCISVSLSEETLKLQRKEFLSFGYGNIEYDDIRFQ